MIFLLLPTQAQAHTPIKGLGGFASGFLHPFFTPPHLLVLLALGVLLGQRPPLRLRRPVMIFAALAAVGLTVTATGALAGGAVAGSDRHRFLYGGVCCCRETVTRMGVAHPLCRRRTGAGIGLRG